METVCPDGAAPAKGAVHRLCEANGEAAQSSNESGGVVGLYDEMHVVVLYSELQDSKSFARRAPESDAKERIDARCTEASDRCPGAQGDVDGVRRHVRRPSYVRHAGATAPDPLPAGTSATPAPGARRWKFELPGSSHLNTAIIAL